MIAVVAEIRRVEMPAAYRQRTTSTASLGSVTLCSPPSSCSRISTRSRGLSAKIAKCPEKGPRRIRTRAPRRKAGGEASSISPFTSRDRDLLDHGVRHLGGSDPIHDQANDAGAPAGSVPLKFHSNEAIARKQRQRALDLATITDPSIAKAWVVGFITGHAETVKREPLPLRLEPRASPVGHRPSQPGQVDADRGHPCVDPRRRWPADR